MCSLPELCAVSDEEAIWADEALAGESPAARAAASCPAVCQSCNALSLVVAVPAWWCPIRDHAHLPCQGRL